MTAAKFRSLALGLSGAIEAAHMGHPDFRVNGRIFASLGHPNEEFGMVGLNPVQQAELLEQAPTVFAPCAGAWGRRGATQVHLPSARVGQIRGALDMAWQNAISKR